MQLTKYSLLIILAITLVTSCSPLRRSELKSSSTPTPTPSQPIRHFPSPSGLVNDYASVIEEESKQRLNASLQKLRSKANIEFAVVTVDSTGGQDIFDYSLALAREWGVGPKNGDGGGILLLLAIKDRKWRIQVSRALEKDLPDDVCKKLGDESTPLYTKNDWGGGIEKYVASLIKQLEQRRGFSID